jgi:hypothetical protein
VRRRQAVLAAAGGIGTFTLTLAYAYAGVVIRWPRDGVDPLYVAELVDGQPARPAPPGATWTDPEPGGQYVGSPDGRYLALTRDARRAYHTVFVWDERTRSLRPVVSIQEGDPGSGASHQYRWSADSRALLISGWGALSLHEVENPLSYAYVIEEDALYRVPHYTRID